MHYNIWPFRVALDHDQGTRFALKITAWDPSSWPSRSVATHPSSAVVPQPLTLHSSTSTSHYIAVWCASVSPNLKDYRIIIDEWEAILCIHLFVPIAAQPFKPHLPLLDKSWEHRSLPMICRFRWIIISVSSYVPTVGIIDSDCADIYSVDRCKTFRAILLSSWYLNFYEDTI
jgi:hypothetical protein